MASQSRDFLLDPRAPAKGPTQSLRAGQGRALVLADSGLTFVGARDGGVKLLGTRDVLQHTPVWGERGERLWGHALDPLNPLKESESSVTLEARGNKCKGIIHSHALIREQRITEMLSSYLSRCIWRERRPGQATSTASEIITQEP